MRPRLSRRLPEAQATAKREPRKRRRAMERAWREHLGNLYRLPEENPTPSLITEGATRQIYVNTYERSTIARTKCIDHWGTTCAVCNFLISDVYGEFGSGYIHVHH